METDFIPCSLKTLPFDLLIKAAQTAVQQNPANEPPRQLGLSPEHLALVTSKYWGSGGVKLAVAFLDNPDASTRAKILANMNAWHKSANVEFMESASADAQVRIAREDSGYWSYLGTDILHIPAGQQTMNLQGFTANTRDSEYVRVVRHETGHTLGFPHEHLRRELVAKLDPARTIAYFMQTQGWSAQEVQQQVLTPLDEATLTATPHADALSIMCYQLPGLITTDGQPIPGGADIDQSDYDLAAKLYPLPDQPPPPINPPAPPVGNGALTKIINELIDRFAQGKPLWEQALLQLIKTEIDQYLAGRNLRVITIETPVMPDTTGIGSAPR